MAKRKHDKATGNPILTEQDYFDLCQDEPYLKSLLSEIEVAERAGISMERARAQVEFLMQRCTGMRETYFPGRKPIQL